MDRFVIIDASPEALDDLKNRLAKESIEYHPFVHKAIGAAEGIAIAYYVAKLAKLVWDWYNSWHARQADIEVKITVYPDNITLRLSPDKRAELEELIRPKNAQDNN